MNIFDLIKKEVGESDSPTISSLSKGKQKILTSYYSQFIKKIEVPKEYRKDMFILLFQIDTDTVSDLCVKHIRVVKLVLDDQFLTEQLAQELEKLYGYTRTSKKSISGVSRANRRESEDPFGEAL